MATRYLNNHICKERLMKFIMYPAHFTYCSYAPAKQKIQLCSLIYHSLKRFKQNSSLQKKKKKNLWHKACKHYPVLLLNSSLKQPWYLVKLFWFLAYWCNPNTWRCIKPPLLSRGNFWCQYTDVKVITIYMNMKLMSQYLNHFAG